MHLFNRPAVLCAALFVVSIIPVGTSCALLWQISTGGLPPESVRYEFVPISISAHTVAGVAFALIGPVQFTAVLRRRFGWLHRLLGRFFALASLGLGLAGMSLLWHFPESPSPLIATARLFGSGALVLFVLLGVHAARTRRMAAHRAWMIRTYAVGIGATVSGLLLLPIFLIRGELGSVLTDLTFFSGWVGTLSLAEWIIRRRPLAGHSKVASLRSPDTTLSVGP